MNFLSAELFNMLEKKCIEITENTSKEFLRNLQGETSTQCIFLHYSENEASINDYFILKLISFLNLRLPKNELSICVMNRRKIYVFYPSEMLFLENFI